MIQVLARKFTQDVSGATAIEYGLVVAIISVVLITALVLTGGEIGNILNAVGNTLGNAID